MEVGSEHGKMDDNSFSTTDFIYKYWLAADMFLVLGSFVFWFARYKQAMKKKDGSDNAYKRADSWGEDKKLFDQQYLVNEGLKVNFEMGKDTYCMAY